MGELESVELGPMGMTDEIFHLPSDGMSGLGAVTVVSADPSSLVSGKRQNPCLPLPATVMGGTWGGNGPQARTRRGSRTPDCSEQVAQLGLLKG